jgi:hypothetical protein
VRQAASRAQMQVRVLVLQVSARAPAGRDTSGREGETEDKTGKRGGNREKNEAAKSPWGGGQSPGESPRNRQNSKWVFEEVRAETRLVSSLGGGGDVGEL